MDAMKKKCKCPEGVPEWVVTYGDMMTLLLCFFILLAAFSEMKKDREYQEVVNAIKEAFGYTGGAGMVPTQESPVTSMIQTLEAIQLYKEPEKDPTRADDPGQVGKEATVRTIREGEKFQVGGRIEFAPGSADLSAQSMAALDSVAQVLRGKNNKIELRGHTAKLDRTPDGEAVDPIVLSYARASAVMRYLLAKEPGLRAEQFRVTGAGPHEPVVARAYTEAAHARNRRVEVYMIEVLVDDLTSEARPGTVIDLPR